MHFNVRTEIISDVLAYLTGEFPHVVEVFGATDSYSGSVVFSPSHKHTYGSLEVV